MSKPFIEIPTYDSGVWSTTTFNSKEDYKEFVESCFKIPGKYEFDETSSVFNKEGRKFQTDGYYCKAPFRSKDYIDYWDSEKAKCRFGAIYRNKGRVWYITRDYYMWLNFLPIYDKEEKRFDFAKVRDAQYHMALYELLAELNHKHCAILKKRQIASSYFHMAKLINQYWFESGAVLKVGASLKDYINEKGSWKMLDEYKNFLNENTAWYRPSNPEKTLSWQQRISIRVNGRDTFKGNKSVILGYSFEKDPTSGVGGPCTYFFHEEAGIAPKMDDTYEFIRPALQSGSVTTGTFIAAGSVGDLDQCEPLKDMVLNPDANDVYPVETDLLDENGTIGVTGLFIPEQWSMPPYIDQYGNSLVQEAVEAIKAERIKWKKDLTPEKYQLRISQKPINIAEAFASRKVSVFPPHLISQQLKRIEDGEYPVEYVDLHKDDSGKIVIKESRKSPIKEFPISKKTEDKTGVICIYERPIKDAPWGTYYASIDPVGEGKTTASESLCSIFIYKTPIEITKVNHDTGEVNNYIEGDKIVASWCGRFDDLKKTHERLELMIELYNAWTLVENNVSLFIQYMILKKKQKYLVPKNMILFLKDLGANASVYNDYGWKNTGTLFSQHLISYAIDFLTEELYTETSPTGEITKIHYGVERIPDPMVLVEMQQYEKGLNVDRLVSLAALVSFARIQQSNRGATKMVKEEDKLEKSNNFSKLNMRSPFKNIGNSSQFSKSHRRNPFKNIR